MALLQSMRRYRSSWVMIWTITVCLPTPWQSGSAPPAAAADQPVSAPLASVDPMDWPYWRGLEMNGISREVGLVDSWDPRKGENLLWQNPALGSRSTPIVMHGKLYTLARHLPGEPGEGEKVICADAATGEILWETSFNVYLSDVPDTRVAWSAVCGDPQTKRVYAQGVSGQFLCLDGDSGAVVWQRSMHEEFGLLTTYGGRTNYPIVFEELVIISGIMINWGDYAKPEHRIIAFNKNDGTVVWFSGTTPLPEDTTYSGPVIGVLNGQLAFVFGAGDGKIWALQPRTGQPIWSYHISLRGVNASPVIGEDGLVVASQSEECADDPQTMGSIVALNGNLQGDLTKQPTSAVLWEEKGRNAMIGKVQPLLVGGRVYAADDTGGMTVFDQQTGKEIAQKKFGTAFRSSPLFADDKIFLQEANGRCYILKPTVEGFKVAETLRLRDTECLGSAIVSHGRIYIPTTTALYCIGKRDAAPKLSQTPVPPTDPPGPVDQSPAHVQLVPAEALVRPGESLQFQVRLFNSKGQFLKETPAEFSLTNSAGTSEADSTMTGVVDQAGKFTAPTASKHQAVYVTAKVGDLTSKPTRIRVVPGLPWMFDFTGLKDVPITWVGMRYRHQVRDINGNPVMVKVTTIPKGTRSQGWLGHPDLHDYTMEADVYANAKGLKLPDAGLTAQRYILNLRGEYQDLQILSWISVPTRTSVSVPFQWEAEKWYRMKFQATTAGEQAILKGKVWPKDQPEPSDWTITLTDNYPNRNGSPGFFANATNAEVFFDNIHVYLNTN